MFEIVILIQTVLSQEILSQESRQVEGVYPPLQLPSNNRNPNVCPSIFFAHKYYRFYIYGAKEWEFMNQLLFQSGSGSVPSVPRSGSAGLQPQVERRGPFNESTLRFGPAWGPIRTRDTGTASRSASRSASAQSRSASAQSLGRGEYRTKRIRALEISFTEEVKALAKPFFTLQIWKAGFFFIDADETKNSWEHNNFLQLCLEECYRAAVGKYTSAYTSAHCDKDAAVFASVSARMMQEHSNSDVFLHEWKHMVHGYLIFHTICRDQNKYSYSFP